MLSVGEASDLPGCHYVSADCYQRFVTVRYLHLQGLAVLKQLTWHNIPEDLDLVMYFFYLFMV